jgi:hypothetical protein
MSPSPLEKLMAAVGDPATADDARASTFARGLVLGALVGAAVAGSAIWQRRHGQPKATIAAADAADGAATKGRAGG